MSMNVLRKYFSVAMAVLMLIMSIGITAHKMVCLVSGAVTFSLIENEDCCATETANTNTVKTQCCDYSTDYFKLDIQTLVSNFNFKFDLVAAPIAIGACSYLFSEISATPFIAASHSPPLITGKEIRILYSVFRI